MWKNHVEGRGNSKYESPEGEEAWRVGGMREPGRVRCDGNS